MSAESQQNILLVKINNNYYLRMKIHTVVEVIRRILDQYACNINELIPIIMLRIFSYNYSYVHTRYSVKKKELENIHKDLTCACANFTIS